MESLKLYIGRVLPPRLFLLSFSLFLFITVSVQAKTIVLGSGTGFITVPGMTGLNPGDVLAINAGQYSGAAFSNLNGITITNNGGPVIFNGQVTLNTLVSCVFSGFQFKNVPGYSIRWDGNSRRCVERNISFTDCLGNTNDASDHNVYNGDTSSLKLYMCTFDSLTLFRSGMLMMGGWGDAKDLVCFMDSIVFSRIKIDSTLGNGTEVRGIIFRIDAYDWKETYKGINTQSGDVGIFLMNGNGKFHNIYRFGGRGYIIRLWNVGLKVPGNTYFYNNIDLNTSQYGTLDTRVDPIEFTQFTTGGNCYIFNNTVGNLEEHIGYWSSLAVVGTFSPPWICQTRNNLGFNLQTNGKPPITMNQSSNTWISDSSNNLYFTTPVNVVDPITCVPVANSPVLGKGLTFPFITDDYYHNPRAGAYDVGAVQHGGAIIPPPPNQPPVVVLTGTSQIITLPVSNTILDGTKSYDPDGSISSYAWTLVSGTGGLLATPAAAFTKVSGLTQGTYVYKLTVTDNNNASSSALDTIIVNPAGILPPIANAGADQTIFLPANSTTVDGSASKDQNTGGSISTYSWTQSSGPSAATIGTPANVSTPVSGLQLGVYVFKLTVTDAGGAEAADSLTITVKAGVNIPPVANAGLSRSIILPVDSVLLDGSLSSDPDGIIVSYSWAQIAGPSASKISNPISVMTNAGGLIAGLYIFELTVTDNGTAISKAQVKITVVASGLQPPVANAGANQTIMLPLNQVTMDGSASTSSGSIVGYSWTQISGPSAATLTTATAAVTNATNLVAGTYIFQLTVTDNNSVTASDSLLIIVNPAANIPPVANAGPSITIILPVNAATLDGSKSSDADGTINAYSWTQISGPNNPGSTGASTAILSLTGLVQGQYNYQLQVTDNSGAIAYAQVKITVVAPPNISPIANAGPDQTITAPSSTVNLDGSSSYDPDGSISSYSWVLISGPGSVTINNGNTVNPNVIGLTPGQFIFQLTVTDNNGATNTDQITITVNPEPTLPNQAPVANAGNNLTITAPISSIGLNGSSSFDPDGTIVHYDWNQVSGPSAATITNNGTATPTVSGLIVGTYTFQLMVTDNNNATNSDQITVTVNPAVNKVNQMPVAFAGADTTIYLPVSGYLLNASGSYDPDGNITAYHWQEISGPNTAGSSSMSSSQTDISNLQAGVYEFQLTVTDNDGATATSMIKISVDAAVGSTDQLLVYPNPASDVIHSRISSTVNGTVRVNVYDMSGKTVLRDQLEKSSEVLERSITVSGLATGMYTIQVNIANRKTMVTKFVKN